MTDYKRGNRPKGKGAEQKLDFVSLGTGGQGLRISSDGAKVEPVEKPQRVKGVVEPKPEPKPEPVKTESKPLADPAGLAKASPTLRRVEPEKQDESERRQALAANTKPAESKADEKAEDKAEKKEDGDESN